MTCSRGILLQEIIHVLKEVIEIFFYNAPYNTIIDSAIAVDKYVSEGDNVAVFADLL